jgi:hypothetical protein
MMMMMSFAVPSNVIGTGYYLDHYRGAIAPTALKANVGIGVGALAIIAKDVYQAKTPEERKKRLQDDALRIALPTAATLLATQVWMKPEGTVYNTTQQAIDYFKQHYNQAFFNQAQTAVQQTVNGVPSVFRPVIWGHQAQQKAEASLETQLQHANEEEHALLDVQVGKLIATARQAHDAFAKTATPQQVYERFVQLQQTAERSVLARAAQAGLPSNHVNTVQSLVSLAEHLEDKAQQNTLTPQETTWHTVLEETVGQLDWLTTIERDKHQLFDTVQANQDPKKALNKLFHHELRLLLPTAEDLSLLDNRNVLPVLQATAKEFVSEAAVPFMLVGGASVASGMVGGLIANKLNNEPPKKNMDVIKEGIFQYVANIVMCGMGAGLGLLVANAAGFTKQEKPLLRFATIVAGLAAGIATGAAIANPLCNVIERVLPNTGGQSSPNTSNTKQRTLEWQDAILHVDDIPTAFSVAGVQALKPLLPAFFIPSGWKTAEGYRNNEEPLAHLSPFDECTFDADGKCASPLPLKPSMKSIATVV